jgi:hypothetical protein
MVFGLVTEISPGKRRQAARPVALTTIQGDWPVWVFRPSLGRYTALVNQSLREPCPGQRNKCHSGFFEWHSESSKARHPDGDPEKSDRSDRDGPFGH